MSSKSNGPCTFSQHLPGDLVQSQDVSHRMNDYSLTIDLPDNIIFLIILLVLLNEIGQCLMNSLRIDNAILDQFQ